MKGEEIIDTFHIVRVCLECQRRGDCNHNCSKCDYAIPGDKLLEAVDKAIEVLVFVEAHKRIKSK